MIWTIIDIVLWSEINFLPPSFPPPSDQLKMAVCQINEYSSKFEAKKCSLATSQTIIYDRILRMTSSQALMHLIWPFHMGNFGIFMVTVLNESHHGNDKSVNNNKIYDGIWTDTFEATNSSKLNRYLSWWKSLWFHRYKLHAEYGLNRTKLVKKKLVYNWSYSSSTSPTI